jgi:hypothetical protein
VSETSYHISQSIYGALKNWPKRVWEQTAMDNGVSVEELKQYFRDKQAIGWEVLPSKGCDNFDPIKGCKGHKS